jgi:hypothetical protein
MKSKVVPTAWLILKLHSSWSVFEVNLPASVSRLRAFFDLATGMRHYRQKGANPVRRKHNPGFYQPNIMLGIDSLKYHYSAMSFTLM